MDFASRLTRSPRAHEPDLGSEALAALPGLPAELSGLVAGAAGCSPYLKSLLETEAEWIAAAFDDPEAALGAELARLRDLGEGVLSEGLRQGKRRIALLSALADLGGVWSLSEVTGALTDLTDVACQRAVASCVGAEIKRGKLPGAREGDAARGGGMAVLAMGKMGARELNYSSDIDLICLFDETRFAEDDFAEARASLVRATRRMAALLSDNTAEGYVFRTDLRLRPDPSVTPVCMAMAAAERYYESLGRTWERAAYIKARACAGDIAAGEGFIDNLRPFVWRRHLDFTAIQDAHDMRLRIRAHRGATRSVSLPGHNVKLGRGGIREIEFFTQTRQLIAGGRDPDLRLRGTCAALGVLARKGWVGAEAAERLTACYAWLREVEHRLQMVNDAQTHSLPQSPEGMQRLAAFMGQEQEALERALRDTFAEVHELCEGFFAPDAAPPPAAEDFDPEVISRWRSYPALRSERAVAIFDRLRPEFLRRLRDTARPDEALLAFDSFLAGLPAGVQLFSLFEANPQLIDLMVDIAGTSPALAAHLARNSGVFDAVIGGDFFAPWPGLEALLAQLDEHLAREGDDYEAKLDSARRWAKEWHFRTGVHHLRGLISAEAAAEQYADLAEVSIRALWPEVVTQFAERHGAPPGRGAVVVGMGSLGAGRLTAVSDLDLIVIYDGLDAEASEGRRPLAVRAYYARLTQALVAALTAPMAEGRLYEVDMRLRPSGSQGPVATSWPSFKSYQSTDAWTWEHLALTRARAVAGSASLAHDLERFRVHVVAAPRDRAQVLSDTAEMRARIRAAKTAAGTWDAKIGPGRLQDIELFSQAACLLAGLPARDVQAGLAAGAETGLLAAANAARLQEAYGLWWKINMAARLLATRDLDPEAMGAGGRALLLRETGAETLDELAAMLQEQATEADAIITAALAGTREAGT